MPNPGDILHYQKYEFEDGTRKNKFFIVLNKTKINSPCLVLQTTSQSKNFNNLNNGCNKNEKVYFIPQSTQACFKKSTYVKLPHIIEFTLQDLLTGSLRQQIDFKQPLTDKCFNELVECLKLFSYDISERHRKLIYANS